MGKPGHLKHLYYVPLLSVSLVLVIISTVSPIVFPEFSSHTTPLLIRCVVILLKVVCFGLTSLAFCLYWFNATTYKRAAVTQQQLLRREFDVSPSHEPIESVGFFHPHIDGGGGGERVVWSLIEGLLTQQQVETCCKDSSLSSSNTSSNGTTSGGGAIRPSPCPSSIRDKPFAIVIFTKRKQRSFSPLEGTTNVFALQDDKELLNQVEKNFGIHLSGLLLDKSSSTRGLCCVFLVELRSMWLLDGAGWFRYFTLCLQAFGSMFLALLCMLQWMPSVWVDTTGASFMAPVVKIFGCACCGNNCRFLSYVHYPTISTDMVVKVQSRASGFNNATTISSSTLLTRLKVYYYRMFAKFYQWAGGYVDVAIANSTWTQNHIANIWGRKDVHIVYPPFNLKPVVDLDNSIAATKDREYWLVSVSQFRPEKEHCTQLRIFQNMMKQWHDERCGNDVNKKKHEVYESIQFHIIGSTRNEGDRNYLERLKETCRERDNFGHQGHDCDEMGSNKNMWGSRVHFHIDVSAQEVEQTLRRSRVFLHTMKHEHFGIAVVEAMAASLVVVAHNSGGIQTDILKPLADSLHDRASACGGPLDNQTSMSGPLGFLCDTEKEFVDSISKGLKGYYSNRDIADMRERTSIAVRERFGNHSEFARKCIEGFGL